MIQQNLASSIARQAVKLAGPSAADLSLFWSYAEVSAGVSTCDPDLAALNRWKTHYLKDGRQHELMGDV
jgi:hypothetical protein